MATQTAEPVANGHRLVTLADLLELPRPHEDVTLPEMGGVTVRLYAVDGAERGRLAAKSRTVPDGDVEADTAFLHEVIAACIPDATIESVSRLPASVTLKLGAVAFRLAGVGAQAIAMAMASLKTTPSAESGSA